MKGYKRQRGDSWQLIVYAGRDSQGKQIYRTKTVRGIGPRAAEDELRKFVSEVETEIAPPSEGEHTVAWVIREWLPTRRQPRGPLSPSGYTRLEFAADHVLKHVGDMKVADLTTDKIEDLYGRLIEEGMSGSSVRKVHTVLRGALRWAKKRGIVGVWATEGADLPPLSANARPPHIPQTEAVKRLIAYILQNGRWDFGVMIVFIAMTGCRRGEAHRLKWRDVNFEAGSVALHDKKTDKDRVVSLDAWTLARLREHHQKCWERSEGKLTPDSYVFSPDPAGARPWSVTPVRRAYAKYLREAGLPHMRLHDLRHHSATRILRDGGSVGEVMDRHGWSSTSMVDRYRHAMPAEDKRVADIMGQAVFGDDEGEEEE